MSKLDEDAQNNAGYAEEIAKVVHALKNQVITLTNVVSQLLKIVEG